MIYRNKRTGVTVDVQSRVGCEDWEEVCVPSPAPAVTAPEKKPARTAAKKTAKR